MQVLVWENSLLAIQHNYLHLWYSPRARELRAGDNVRVFPENCRALTQLRKKECNADAATGPLKFRDRASPYPGF